MFYQTTFFSGPSNIAGTGELSIFFLFDAIKKGQIFCWVCPDELLS